MLQLEASKAFDLGKVSMILTKGPNAKVSISGNIIMIEGEFSENLLKELCKAIEVKSIKNFGIKIYGIKISSITCNSITAISSPVIASTYNSNNTITDVQEENAEETEETELFPGLKRILQYDLIYASVRRGEVYWCDFGDRILEGEMCKLRPAIVVQNDVLNKKSPITFVVLCSSNHNRLLPTHYFFQFSKDNMSDYSSIKLWGRTNVAMAECSTTVNKVRLRTYIGRMSPAFMKEIDKILKVFLAFEKH